MLYKDMLQIVKDLSFDEELQVLNDNNAILSIIRPYNLSARFRNYNRDTNFQVFLSENGSHFKPNHLRVMIDLNLRVRCRPDLKEKLLYIFDNIFYGHDPEEEIKILEGERFEHHLNSLRVIANLAQLFLIEQEYGYHKESYYSPPTLFFQGWIRAFIDSTKEIDELCMRVSRPTPPSPKYVFKENKKDKRYESMLPALWYLK